MTYARKLLAAKLLITGCMVFYSIVPVFIDFGPSHIASETWTAHGRFHLSWILITNMIAMPVLLMALWSKLHGTGRSVRLVGFLGLAYTLGFFVAAALRGRFGSVLHDAGHAHLMLGFDGNLVVNAVMTLLIAIGIMLSIKPRSEAS